MFVDNSSPLKKTLEYKTQGQSLPHAKPAPYPTGSTIGLIIKDIRRILVNRIGCGAVLGRVSEQLYRKSSRRVGMDVGFGLVLVCIVCVLGHIATAWWFSYTTNAAAGEIDERIGLIDEALGMLAVKLMDPSHWQQIMGEITPVSNPFEALIQHIVSQKFPGSVSPGDVYTRNEAGQFNGAPELIEEVISPSEDI